MKDRISSSPFFPDCVAVVIGRIPGLLNAMPEKHLPLRLREI
jgi:hypothetical protein